MGPTDQLFDISTLLHKNAYSITKNQAHVGEATVRMRRTYKAAEVAEHGAFYPIKGMETRIYSGWGKLLFAGNAYKINWRPLSNSSNDLPARDFEILCVDWTRVLNDRVLFKVYENMTVGDIIKDIINNYEFLPPNGTPGTGTILGINDKFQIREGDVVAGPLVSVVFNGDPLTDAFDKLVQASNTDLAQYAWWVGVDRDFHYYPLDQTIAPLAAFRLGDRNAVVFDGSFKAEETDEKYANEVIVQVSEDAVASQIDSTIPDMGEGTITPLGDGVVQTFNVTKPISSVRKVSINGIEDTFSVGPEADHPGSSWYFKVGSTEIVQAADGIPIADTDDLQWEYVPMFANLVGARDEVEQENRRQIENVSGHHQIIIIRNDIKSLGAAQALADSILSKVVKPAVRMGFSTYKPNESYDYDLTPGMLIDGNLSDLMVVQGGPFMIDEVTLEMTETGAILYTVSAFGGALLGNYIDFFRALARGGVATGGVTLGAFDEGFWHIRGELQEGKNETNHHEFSRDCSPVLALASTVDGPPTADCVIDLTIDGISILGDDKLIIESGENLSKEPVVFSLPLAKRRQLVELNVITPSDASNVNIYLFSL